MEGFDPTNDADLETVALEEAGNRAARLERLGICVHGWLQGTPGADGPVVCNDCGQVFRSWDAAHDAQEDVMLA